MSPSSVKLVAMTLPVSPPVSPMLSKSAESLPSDEGWWFEPKWDGFRCIVFRDGDEVELGSRNERPLTRYFPEILGPLRDVLPERAVVDGELIIPGKSGRGLDFEALLQRIHPAEKRVRLLAEQTPSAFVAFDLLAVGDRSLMDMPFVDRRRALEKAMASAPPWVFLTPITADRTLADDWFARFEGAGLDGVMAKRGELGYRPGERVMIKVKHHRTADCVVAGYRVHKDGNGVGSLLLGLYDHAGVLHHIGVASSFTAARRRELLEEFAPLVATELDEHPWREWAIASAHETARLPGAQSRWNAKKDLSFVALRLELVAEVAFDQMQGDRLRHAGKFVRWRPDRDPASCQYEQLEVTDPVALGDLFV
jgi:ATP-dependent DNA ligase